MVSSDLSEELNSDGSREKKKYATVSNGFH